MRTVVHLHIHEPAKSGSRDCPKRASQDKQTEVLEGAAGADRRAADQGQIETARSNRHYKKAVRNEAHVTVREEQRENRNGTEDQVKQPDKDCNEGQ